MENTNELYEIIENLSPTKLNKKIDDNTNIMEDLHFDSIAIVEFFAEIERKYGVDFTELPDFLDRISCVKYIQRGIDELILKNRRSANSGMKEQKG